MATLHLMVGLPGSGKTTEAIKLEYKYKALRLTPDEWQYFLFGHDISDKEHDSKRGLQRWNFPFKSFEIVKLY